jgi:Transposase DDE domain
MCGVGCPRWSASGAIYVVDRNFIDFKFLQAVLDAGSDFVVRCRSDAPRFAALQERPRTDEDGRHGVDQDTLGTLPGTGAPRRPLRELILTDRQTGQSIRVLTSLLDLPAYMIGLLYRRRWQVELFFRWLKVWANFEHLISHSRNGLTIQFYVAVIGVLLTHVATGRRVSKYALNLLGFVASGQATLEDILPELERREREKRLERERLARRRAQKLGQ